MKAQKKSADSIKPFSMAEHEAKLPVGGKMGKPKLVGKNKFEAKGVTYKVSLGAKPPPKPNLEKMAPKEFAKFRNAQTYK